MPNRKRFAALDTSFLQALAVGDEDCEDVVDWLNKYNFYPLAPCTAMQELADIELLDEDPFETENAVKAQRSLSAWGILDASLEPIQHGIAQVAARRLVEKKVIPDEHENDGLVLAEAALHECILLLTFRRTLLEAPPAGIDFMLIECDLPKLSVLSPRALAALIRRVG